ncbi:hypothetical protein U1Q18_038686 [Sarracenia purpurea var. burkii]
MASTVVVVGVTPVKPGAAIGGEGGGGEEKKKSPEVPSRRSSISGDKGVVCGAGTCSAKHGRGFRRGVSISGAIEAELGSEIRRRKIGSESATRVSTDQRKEETVGVEGVSGEKGAVASARERR